MKEIWMEKLIELLNKYSELRDERVSWEEWQPIRKRKKEHLEYPIEKIRIISRYYWFIKRLVENEKIDKDKVKLLSVFQETWYYNLYQSLLMILSISDTPIDDLCGYLKDDNEELRIEREFQKWNTIFPM